ncbi:cobalamin B12-binding domain-containing protein [Mameliella alba]|uniref:cobalamin B12-binding domain-containing protein n=1 Tax=Mameliella alba TaxID=561184 RepID=UPI001FD8011B|nr:cobalamin B12-binding domain-containing protein [Mameliella alba]
MSGRDQSDDRDTAIRFLVEAALKSVADKRRIQSPQTKDDWIDRLCEEIMSASETSHQAVLSSLIATGVTSDEVLGDYVPAVARRIGELWVQDKATFVQVTIGAARLQALFQNRTDLPRGTWLDRTVPLGQSILMILPAVEDHTLGAFVAADQFRRHGLWVRMAIRLSNAELLRVVEEGRFSMLGISMATYKSVENVQEIIKNLKSSLDRCPPIVVGGKYVADSDGVEVLTGADLAVRSAREAIEGCGLASVAKSLTVDSLA